MGAHGSPDTGTPLPPLREVIAAYGLIARKSLGQHFLLDLNLTRRIARAAGDLTGATVIEIGPGPGGLTRALLLEGAARVIAIERDERCVRALAELAAAFPGRLDVIAGDALEIDACALARQAGGRVLVVANLPYNIATPLILSWLRDVRAFASLTLMLQKEVAQRLAAAPRTKAYGRLSVMCQWRCEAKTLFDVPARAFTPPPKVTSTVVQLRPRPEPLGKAEPDILEKVVAAAFGQRRKMLRAALKTLASDAGMDAVELLTAAGIAPTARAEELGAEEFCALARAFAAA
ncbi:MAG TPA: 16S rRNA (adenine(1518)-N(6)/adenine(1519)-N(6))-dimethyltransferase RsmA [Alphaproteobacteria bacterium]|nr:16S rRNA (adenine(1518)-N(6)/adenine(1519)-N(6))-dimethyltransferase RsmA [Alphaproteobacteria bacterium]